MYLLQLKCHQDDSYVHTVLLCRRVCLLVITFRVIKVVLDFGLHFHNVGGLTIDRLNMFKIDPAEAKIW